MVAVTPASRVVGAAGKKLTEIEWEEHAEVCLLSYNCFITLQFIYYTVIHTKSLIDLFFKFTVSWLLEYWILVFRLDTFSCLVGLC